MMRWSRHAAVLIVAAFVAACAGTNFARLTGQDVKLGVDSEATVRNKLGSPFQEGTVTKHDRQFRVASYAYSSTTGKAVASNVTPARAQSFYFHQGTLVGHEFTSSWAEDSTDFYEGYVDQIVANKTSMAEVVRMLGEPGGEYIYPLTEREGERAAVYRYEQATGSAFSLRFLIKSLVVSYDENGIVTDVDFVKSE